MRRRGANRSIGRSIVAALSALVAGSCAANLGPIQPAATGSTLVADASPHGPAVLIPEQGPETLPEDFDGDVAPSSGAEVRGLSFGIRLVYRPDGTVERSQKAFPDGADISPTELPSRLGGGFIFLHSTRNRSELWRAKSWLSEAKPWGTVPQGVTEVIPGFKRVYLRLKTGELVAVNPETNRTESPARLPSAPGYGPMVFADSWRAIVVSKLQGALMTFDAGASWHGLNLGEVRHLFLDGGNIVARVRGTRGLETLRIDERGGVQRDRATGLRINGHPPAVEAESAVDRGRSELEFGARREKLGIHQTMVEFGWPLDDQWLVAIDAGEVLKVDRNTLKVVERRRFQVEYPSVCRPIDGAKFVTFVCRSATDTRLVTIEKSLRVRTFSRFHGVRYVASSGNGRFVVRGRCPGDHESPVTQSNGSNSIGTKSPGSKSSGSNETLRYCIVANGEAPFPIMVRGEVGAERVVGLTDGRAAVVIPPRFGSTPQLMLIDGSHVEVKPLTFTKDIPPIAKQGVWLRPLRQLGKTPKLAGWVERGGHIAGLRIDLESREVSAYKPYKDNSSSVLVSGRYALALHLGTGAAQSTNGGESWERTRLPDVFAGFTTPQHRRRLCSPVGCRVAGWTRLGWAVRDDSVSDDSGSNDSGSNDSGSGDAVPRGPAKKPAESDFVKRPTPFLSSAPVGVRQALSTGIRSSVRLKCGPAQISGVPERSPQREYVWRDVRDSSVVHASLFASRDKRSTWVKSANIQAVLLDPYAGYLRSSVSEQTFADEKAVRRLFGQSRGRWMRWRTPVVSVAGGAGVLSACRGRSCDLFGVIDGEPIRRLQHRDSKTGLAVPMSHQAKIVLHQGEFYLTSSSSRKTGLALWKLGSADTRRVAHLDVHSRVTFTRRRDDSALGFVYLSRDVGAVPHWFAAEFDLELGRVAAPVALPKANLPALPRPCRDSDGGWVVDGVNVTFDATSEDGTWHGEAKARLRVDVEGACTESLRVFAKPPPLKEKPKAKHTGRRDVTLADDQSTVPLWATKSNTGLVGRRCKIVKD